MDMAYGMIISHAVGDALGALHEFNRHEKFTGLCDRPFVIKSRFQGNRVSSIGQTTDDNTMTVVLLKVICEGYSVENAIKHYIDWASHTSMLGKNTRLLFRGIKTSGNFMKTYQVHKQKAPVSQSNGCMMRCSPIALILNSAERRKITIQDCEITNPAKICVYANIIYIEILHCFLYGKTCDVPSIISSLSESVNENLEQFAELWKQSQFPNWNTGRVIHGPDKGWIMHALYCAFVAVTYNGLFIELMRLLVEMGGDTDTNMAISGAVMGARFGYKKLSEESYYSQNVNYVLNSDWTQSNLYKGCDFTTYFHPCHIMSYISQLHSIVYP